MSIAGQQERVSANESTLARNDPGPGMTVGLGLLFALGYGPLLTLFFINLWGRPHYQFFPLAMAGAGFLAWTRLTEAPRPFDPGRPLITFLLVAASWFCLMGATVLWSPWLGGIAAFIGLAGFLWWRGGKPLLRSMLPALLLVLTIIPPPLAADTRLVEQLRVLAVRWSSRLLDVLGVTHALSGNVIELPGQKLLVDEACSGINSVLITLAACLFYGLWRRRSAIHILVCLTSTLSFVLLGNLARITLGAWLRFRYNIDILSGWRHELTGLVLFVGYLAMILSMDQLLVFLTSPTRRHRQPAGPLRQHRQRNRSVAHLHCRRGTPLPASGARERVGRGAQTRWQAGGLPSMTASSPQLPPKEERALAGAVSGCARSGSARGSGPGRCGGICLRVARAGGPWAGVGLSSAFRRTSGAPEIGLARRGHVRHAGANWQLEAA